LIYQKRLSGSNTGLDKKHRKTGSPFIDKGRLRAFSKGSLLQKLGNYSASTKSSYENDEAANTALYFKGHLFVMSGY